MAFLVQPSFSALQESESEQYSAVATLPAGTGEGEPLGAIFNAVALMAVQEQQQTAYVATISRLKGCEGADCDSFCAPFGIPRTGAVASSNNLTFALPSVPSTPQPIPVGTILITPDGLKFQVLADTTNPAFSVISNAYFVTAPAQSCAVATVCQTAGSISNIPAGTQLQIFSSPGATPISSSFMVTAPALFDNGADVESDDDYKNRFASVFGGQNSGAPAAIAGAVESVQPNLTYSVGDGLATDGTTRTDGFFTVVVNVQGQASGPGGALITAVRSAVRAVKPIGISFDVIAPTLLPVAASASFKITPPAGSTTVAVLAATAAAYDVAIDAIGLDPEGGTTTLAYGRVYAILYGVPGVTQVDGLQLNGTAGSDIVASFGQQIVAGATTFTSS